MELFALEEKHDYDFTPETAPDISAAYASADEPLDQSLTTAFSCMGTLGTLGTAGGCISTVGSFGCGKCGGPTPIQPR